MSKGMVTFFQSFQVFGFHRQDLFVGLFFPCYGLVIPPKTLFGGYIGVSLSVSQSVRWSVCSFLFALFLINYRTNFIQTSQVNSVSSRDVHMKCWLWFIDFSLSYGPFMKFLVRSFSHQLLDRFGSNYTNRLSIKQKCAYAMTGRRAASPILCPEPISKTMLAMVMKLHGWIDLKAECSAMHHNSRLFNF